MRGWQCTDDGERGVKGRWLCVDRWVYRSARDVYQKWIHGARGARRVDCCGRTSKIALLRSTIAVVWQAARERVLPQTLTSTSKSKLRRREFPGGIQELKDWERKVCWDFQPDKRTGQLRGRIIEINQDFRFSGNRGISSPPQFDSLRFLLSPPLPSP